MHIMILLSLCIKSIDDEPYNFSTHKSLDLQFNILAHGK